MTAVDDVLALFGRLTTDERGEVGLAVVRDVLRRAYRAQELAPILSGLLELDGILIAVIKGDDALIEITADDGAPEVLVERLRIAKTLVGRALSDDQERQ